jgi:hypothetical protein
MEQLKFKGKGEHSVNDLELIIEQQAEELHLIKSGQTEFSILNNIEKAAPDLLKALIKSVESMKLADEVEFRDEIKQAEQAINKALK